MSLLPTDWVSFLWGAALTVVAVFGAGLAAFGNAFLKKAAEDFYGWGKIKVRPPPPEPVEVHSGFVPTRYPPDSCGWIGPHQLVDCEAEGWTYYPHPKNDAKCYRIQSVSGRDFKEFLMVKPTGSATTIEPYGPLIG
jgi:hypothetical protein